MMSVMKLVDSGSRHGHNLCISWWSALWNPSVVGWSSSTTANPETDSRHIHTLAPEGIIVWNICELWESVITEDDAEAFFFYNPHLRLSNASPSNGSSLFSFLFVVFFFFFLALLAWYCTFR